MNFTETFFQKAGDVEERYDGGGRGRRLATTFRCHLARRFEKLANDWWREFLDMTSEFTDQQCISRDHFGLNRRDRRIQLNIQGKNHEKNKGNVHTGDRRFDQLQNECDDHPSIERVRLTIFLFFTSRIAGQMQNRNVTGEKKNGDESEIRTHAGRAH